LPRFKETNLLPVPWVGRRAGGRQAPWTARVSSRSAVRPGAPLELAVDISRLHFFDPASGESIGRLLSAGVLPASGVG
jgi:hypothetical protein